MFLQIAAKDGRRRSEAALAAFCLLMVKPKKNNCFAHVIQHALFEIRISRILFTGLKIGNY